MTDRIVFPLWWLAAWAALGCQSSEPGEDPSPAGGGSLPIGGMSPQAGGIGSQAGAAYGGRSSAGDGGGGSAASAGAGRGGSSTGGVTGSAGTGGGTSLTPLEECATPPSLDRLTQWLASGEGLTEPKTGSILVNEGSGYVARVHFIGSEWHVIPVYIANQFGRVADLSASRGITLTYSATADLHVQLRSQSHWSGGAQYATGIASTAGVKTTRFFSFDQADWKSLFDAPAISFSDTLKEGMGLVFVGNSENEVVIYGLRIDAWTPPCP